MENVKREKMSDRAKDRKREKKRKRERGGIDHYSNCYF